MKSTLCAALLAWAQGKVVYETLEATDVYVDFFRPTIDLDWPAYRARFSELGRDVMRLAYLVNDEYQYPIYAEEGDYLQVEIINTLRYGTVSVHFYGVDQRDTPYYDGTFGFTDCSVYPYQNMTMNFALSKPGTYMYVGTVGNALQMGLQGPLVVYAKDDPHKDLYDVDEVVTLTDFWRYSSLLVIEEDTTTAQMVTLFNGQHGDGTSEYPFPLLHVEHGLRYRYRFVCTASQRAYRVNIWGHSMTIIAIDGTDMVPKTVDDISLYPGDRVDVVVHADQPVGNYRILVQEIQNNILAQDPNPSYAFVHYEGTGPPTTQAPVQGSEIVVEENMQHSYTVNYDSMKNPSAMEPLQKSQPPAADTLLTYKMGVLSTPVGEHPAFYLFNSRTPFTYPTAPFLQQNNNCGTSVSNTLKALPTGATVELILDNLSNEVESIHLHGYKMYILGTGYIPNSYTDAGNDADPTAVCPLDMEYSDERLKGYHRQEAWGCVFNKDRDYARLNVENPIQKDTVHVPARTWAVVRFIADHAGVWSMESNNLLHQQLGMRSGFDVGHDNPIRELPQGFPTCSGCVTSDLQTAEKALAVATKRLLVKEQLLEQATAAAVADSTVSAEQVGTLESVESEQQDTASGTLLTAEVMLPTIAVLSIGAVLVVKKYISSRQEIPYAAVPQRL